MSPAFSYFPIYGLAGGRVLLVIHLSPFTPPFLPFLTLFPFLPLSLSLFHIPVSVSVCLPLSVSFSLFLTHSFCHSQPLCFLCLTPSLCLSFSFYLSLCHITSISVSPSFYLSTCPLTFYVSLSVCFSLSLYLCISLCAISFTSVYECLSIVSLLTCTSVSNDIFSLSPSPSISPALFSLSPSTAMAQWLPGAFSINASHILRQCDVWQGVEVRRLRSGK